MLPTDFRTFHFVSFLYVFFFSFLFLLFRFFSHYFVFFFFAFRFFRFFLLLFSLFSFRFFFFPFLFVFSVSQFTGTPEKMIGNHSNIFVVDGVIHTKNGGKTYASCASSTCRHQPQNIIMIPKIKLSTNFLIYAFFHFFYQPNQQI